MIWFDVVFVPCQTGTSLDRVSQSNDLRSGPSTTTEKQRGYRANIRLDCEIIGPVTASSLACLETAFVQVRISISQCWGEATEIAPQSVRSVSSCMRKTNECVVMRSIRPPPAFSLTTSNLDSLSVLIPPVWKKLPSRVIQGTAVLILGGVLGRVMFLSVVPAQKFRLNPRSGMRKGARSRELYSVYPDVDQGFSEMGLNPT